MSSRVKDRDTDELIPASEGRGPLLERDYWATLTDCPLRPAEVIDHVARHFCEFPPDELVEFAADPANGECLPLGSSLDIRIHPATDCAVKVIHRDRNSFTLGTMAGHPEAGRITFGAYRNPADDVILHIRSRARASSTGHLLGFLAIGDAMQTNTWTDFIANAAASIGAGIAGAIHVEKREVEDAPDDDEDAAAPTFAARGD